MATITLDLPDDLAQQLHPIGDRLPELIALSLQQPAIPAHIYHYVLSFLASNPTPAEVIAFRPTDDMQQRLKTLLARSQAGELTPIEAKELEEYARIEHLIVMIKTGMLPHLTTAT